MLQCLVGTPTGTAKTNTNDTIIVTAMATDQDANDTLTYTLWWGDSSGNLSKTNIVASAKQGNSVTLTQTGLSNDTRYHFKVVVSDGINDTSSNESNEKTYCKGDYCDGGYYEYPACTPCNGTGQITCTASGCVNGKVNCSNCSGTGINGTETITCRTCNGSRSRSGIFRW